ncbi:MAG: phage nozzle protein [Lysobacteraceae bacterium]
MSLVTRQLPALFNGVSQQPAPLRLPSQCEDQVNAYGTVVDGLRKRPPFETVAMIDSGQDWSSAFIQSINRDTAERYIVVITDGDLKVFDLAGVEQVVNFPVGKQYLETAGEEAREFAMVTVADYSFVVNRSRTVATRAAPQGGLPPDSQYWYNPWYEAGAINDERFYLPPPGTFRGVKQTFEQLPRPDGDTPPFEGDVWRIAGYDQDSFQSYWVIRRGGVWEETCEPGSGLTLDETTMPHALVRAGNGEFFFQPFAWDVRKVGDNRTNPPPTFVGKSIRDVFFHANRLGFVSDENVIFSTIGQFGNFWRQTITDLIDSDLVDISVGASKVSKLNYAVPFQNQLMLFSDQTQFVLNTESVLTPTSASVDTASEYEVNTRVRPLGVGNDVYFVTEAGRYSRFREYYVQSGDGFSTDTSDITAHVPRYIPRGVHTLAGSTNEDVLFALSLEPGQRNRMWCYKWFWDGESKAQSAWGVWELEPHCVILSATMLDSRLYILVQRGAEQWLESCELQSAAMTGDLDFHVLLDRLATISGSYNDADDSTTFALPYTLTEGEQSRFRMVYGDWSPQRGGLVDPSQYQFLPGSLVKVPGRVDGEVHCGIQYEFRYVFSEQFLMANDRAITTGRLMLRTFVLYFTRSGFFRTEVAPYGTNPDVETIIPAGLSSFTGKTIGDQHLVLNAPSFSTGRYVFQVHGDSRAAKVALTNDSHVQASFQSAEWEALYHNRARTM